MTSVYKGSPYTLNLVYQEIKNRWGEKEAEDYDPRKNCFTYRAWKEMGYQVKKGEKAIKSITFVPIDFKDKKTGKVETKSVPRNVNLFYQTQVDKIEQ